MIEAFPDQPLSYEVSANPELTAHIEELTSRADALYEKMDKESYRNNPVSINPYVYNWPWRGTLNQEADTDVYSIHLLPVDGGGRGLSYGCDLVMTYSPQTRRMTGNSRPWGDLSPTVWQNNLPQNIGAAFESLLNVAIYEHYDFLTEQRSREQKSQDKIYLEESEDICKRLLASEQWHERPDLSGSGYRSDGKGNYSYIDSLPSSVAQSKNFMNKGLKIEEIRHGHRIITKERINFFAKVFGLKQPNITDTIEWRPTEINADIDGIIFSAAQGSSYALSNNYILESEKFDRPSQLHLERDLVKRLREGIT